ncbi:hypothetical protein EDF46_0718 [Frondihabitans sp. PhB188]|uniref:hypothetical protein n=1 Tax=Frondihabitans sp. PhB188 TaxID=2485200 RepID=UPI000FB91312|nr:hypothetical protein [Frondihabitans sp. PhB188]ROQ41341.1 hypothetical protein EDF46_0718 [Frondihabitans sp. PhB188]
MSIHRAENASSPFSEVRQIHRDRTWAVIAVATLSASSFVIAGALTALGVLA